MWLVEVEKVIKLQTACTLVAMRGMVVRTGTEQVHQARKAMLEFELANHPLDCPVCDKGGECPLQDFTFRHGYPTSRIDGPRLHFKKPIPLSENIALDRASNQELAVRSGYFWTCLRKRRPGSMILARWSAWRRRDCSLGESRIPACRQR